MPFDVQAARSAGYSDAEIADEMAKDSAFDTAGARSAGYSDAEIIAELSTGPQPPGPVDQPTLQPIDSPERRALAEELRQRLGAAEQAGKKLQTVELLGEGIARPLLRGLTVPADALIGIPRLATNLGIAGANAAFGTEVPGVQPLTSGRLGPQNRREQYADAAVGGAASALTGVGVGQALSQSANQVTRGVGTALASNPILQSAGGVTGGLSAAGAREAGAGPVLETLAGIAGGLAPGAVVGAANKFATGAARTPEAQRLLDRGVDLTPGQLKPTGRINQIEEGTQSIGLVGPTIAAGRQNARDTFQRAAIQQGAAPGTRIAQAQPAQMLDEAYNSFKPLYDAAKGFPASAQIVNAGQNVPLSRALRQAVRNAGIIATDEERKAVSRFLQSQLTKGVNTSDDLLNIRSSIRDESRQAFRGGNVERSRLLDAADDQVTQALDSQLPQQALQKLKTADAKYGDYKTVEAAVARSKDRPGGFTPNDLSEAVAAAGQGAGRGSYARGAGGSLRELASDARTVLDARSPPTGARLLALAPGAAAATIDPLTGLAVQGATTAGIALGAGTQTGRRLAAGATAGQQAILRQLRQRGLINPGLPYSTLAGQLSPTAQIVGEMIGIPRGTPPGSILGLDQQQEEQRLRAGLIQ